MRASFTLTVLGCCRACGARNVNKLRSFHREHGRPAATTAALQDVQRRLEIYEVVCPDYISKKNHSCGLGARSFKLYSAGSNLHSGF